jgi:hypothetical protein
MDALGPLLAAVPAAVHVLLDNTGVGALGPLLAAVLTVLCVLQETMQQLSALRLRMSYASYADLADTPILRA